MPLIAHEPTGHSGVLVTVQVDIRRGIPGIDLVGLASGAVREAKERVRVAVGNSGFRFPADRILINLSPADLPKEGSSYDLPIALAVLTAAGMLPETGNRVLALGELTLDGLVRPVRGVLSAVIKGMSEGIDAFIVPPGNLGEAMAAHCGTIHAMESLADAAPILERIRRREIPGHAAPEPEPPAEDEGDFLDILGNADMKRALEVAAAGGHNVILFGPPGTGKTMAGMRFASILPDLSRGDALESAALHSLAGKLPAGQAISFRPRVRAPHHSATLEGMVGGGRIPKPGEISLAHRGVLVLDEATEFRKNVLQALREPVEEGWISIARANETMRYPADFQLVATANPCLCGNLGRKGRTCVCSADELGRYWKKLGGPLMDRIDIRCPVSTSSSEEICRHEAESSSTIRTRVTRALSIQEARLADAGIRRNAEMLPRIVARFCTLDTKTAMVFDSACDRLGFGIRARHSVLRVARTIADLSGDRSIEPEDVLEAVQYRMFGECDSLWPHRDPLS